MAYFRNSIMLGLLFMNFLLGEKVWAGAVSAGGLQAPAKFECLFFDTEQPNVPFNYLAYESSAELLKVDLTTRDEKMVLRVPELSQLQTSESQKLSGFIENTGLSLDVEMKSQVLVVSEYQKMISPFTELLYVDFVANVTAHRASLTIGARSFSGVCTEGPMLSYYPEYLDESAN